MSTVQKEENMENDEMIKAEYFPSVSRGEIVRRSKYRMSLRDLSGLGSGFSLAAAAFAKAAKTAPSGEVLYRCVFPKGVHGKLAAFKDGSGLLGTIINEKGIAAQARWIPVKGGSTEMVFDPVTLALAVVMMEIKKKLDIIQETQVEILQFLHRDKESELEGSINALADILEQYRFNDDNAIWKSGKLTVVTTIKGKAESNIIFYRKCIAAEMDKQRAFHSYSDAEKVKKSLERFFKYYQLSVYLSAYASFLEVVLAGNYEQDYLEHMAAKIREYAFQYRMDYSNCYERLEEYMKGSLQAVVLGRIGKAGTAAGKMLAKVPILSKGPVDEALIMAGKKIEGAGVDRGKTAMKDFRNIRDAGTEVFARNIETFNELCNRPLEVLFDGDEVYLCA